MKIIFIKDLRGQGKKNEIKEVKDGYAKNFLIKNGYAVQYTNTSINRLEDEIKKQKEEDNQNKEKANKLKAELEKTTLEFKLKAGANDKVFGSISSKQIIEELKKLNYNIDKKNILLDEHLSSLGYHNVAILLYKEIKANIKVKIIKE
jgi:large subunit ribosomal protein L9